VLLPFTPDKTGAIGWPATKAGCIIAIIVIWGDRSCRKSNPQNWSALSLLTPEVSSPIARVPSRKNSANNRCY
jgi:hypothetical protein